MGIIAQAIRSLILLGFFYGILLEAMVIKRNYELLFLIDLVVGYLNELKQRIVSIPRKSDTRILVKCLLDVHYWRACAKYFVLAIMRD